MDEQERSHYKKPSTSQDSVRMEIVENGNWTNVKTVHRNEPTIHSNDNDVVTSYSTNREKIYHRNAGTIEEIHVLESSGRTTRNFAEEHWSSKIKSYVMPQPPKFIQVIKAFRVLATDTLTLVVEVQSDPPAIFEWFCNDKPVQQNRQKFKARHGINITTLTVEGPEQGVYKCTARNPVGISTTYGYVTVNAPPSYKTWLEQIHEVNEEMSMEINDKENIETTTDLPPKFIQQIPNLTLRPGTEAVIDVEVEASPPAKFTWYVNGVQFRDAFGQIEVYYPMANRCIARFPIPQKGEYKVIAENRAGKEHSIGYIDVKKEVMYHQTQLPPLPSDHIYHHTSYNESEHHEMPVQQGRGRASSLSRMVDSYEESSFYERSTSVPKQFGRPYEIKKTTEMIRKRKDDSNQLQEEERHREQQYSSSKEFVEMEKEQLHEVKRRRYSEKAQLPQQPIFIDRLPTEIPVGSDEDLVLRIGFKACPRADVKWSVNGFELKDSEKVTIINGEDQSTLIVRPPIRYGRYYVTITNEHGINNQNTRVYQGQNKQYKETEKSHSVPPEITGSSVPICTTNVVFDEWELLDEHQRSSRSVDSFETIKHVETVQVPTEGHETPTSHQSFHASVHNEKIAANYEARRIPPQPLPKPMTPVIHEPLRGQNVSVVSEASRASPYTEKRYEEIISGVSRTVHEALPKVMQQKSLTDTTLTEQKYEDVHTRSDRISSPKLKSQKEFMKHGIIEKKTFRIPVHRAMEQFPKHPFILKQPEPEIRLKAGEKLVLESKVDSSPESQFKWYQNNFEVRPSPSVIIESPAINESRATFLKPVSGTYKMVASNIHGSCSSTTRVITEVTEEWGTESAISVVRTVPEKQEVKYQPVKRFHTLPKRNDLPKRPRIVEGFVPILKIANNEPLVLRVTVDAIPEAEFRWMLNNFEVRTSQTITIEHLSPNVSQATFYSPISGRYEVIAMNSLGQDSCSAKVIVDYAEEQQVQVVPIQRIKKPTVPQIPQFINPLPGETQLSSEEQEFRLSVSVHGEQPITFRWFADGSLLSNSVEHQMINDLESSTLVVRKQTGCDVDYAVEVSNAYGAVWSETTVKPPSLSESSITNTASQEGSLLEIDDVQRCSPRYTVVLMDRDLRQNDEFTTHVAINAESCPCEFIWMLNGRDIRTIPGFRVASTFHESTLHVKSALSKHSGELSVIASNKYGTAKSAANINVHPSLEESYEIIWETGTVPAERPPRIVSPLQSSIFRAGESLELRCRVDGLPRPEVFWTKDEIRVDDSVITRQYPDGRYELISPQCAPKDAGLYQLTARNIHGITNTSAYIQIEKREIVETTTKTKDEIQMIHRATSKPRFKKALSKQFEDEVVVCCQVISETPVLISWYKDGQQLYQTYKYRMQKLSDNTHTLTICKIDRRDEGTYICRAENTYGSSETSMYIRSSARTPEMRKEVLVEENESEVVGLQNNTGYVKKKYTDTTVKVLVEPAVSGSQEVYSHTAEIRKSEEEYKLLVKVAEVVASKLIAKVVIDEAIRIALRRMNKDLQSSEEEEFEPFCEQQSFPPRFETNIECNVVDVGDTVVLRTDIAGYPQPRVEWYFGEQKLEQSEQIDVKYVNKQATLTIKKVEKKHEGIYYCLAENEYGKAILPCNLCVTDIGEQWSESTHKMMRPSMTYTLSETETEVSSNVHITHAAESYDHYFSSIQPETLVLGYSCLASTSKVHDDSVIVTRESMQKVIEREQEIPEAYINLNVNVERTPSLFKHDTRILQSANESVTISRREPRYTRAEEVIQTNDIFLISDQHILQNRQSMINAITTVVFEKPPQRAVHEVICLYDDKAHASEENIQAISSINLQKVEIVDEFFSTIMAAEEKFREAYAETNVDVKRPDALFDHFITVVESEHEHLEVRLIAPLLVTNLATCDFHFQQKPESLHAESVHTEYTRRNAAAEQRIIILESSFQKFSEAITWSLKKVSKVATDSGITAVHANIKIYKPEEIGEHATTIVDTRKIVPELFAIAAAASKFKLTSIFVTFTKKGDVAHQALVIEYESLVEDEATLNVATLTAPGFRSKQESVWSIGKKYEKAEEIEADVVAAFLEVNVTCPNQNIELVASISLPLSAPDIMDITRSSQPFLEPSSASLSESSSTGLFQAPKFVKILENMTAIVGQFHQFKCIVSGAPSPRIRWYVDGDIIRDSDVYQTIYEDGVCILKIQELAIEDEGEYTCEAVNDAGQAITKCFLQTITEADVLKYHQQAIFKNILYSNGGSNTNNSSDKLGFLDNLKSFSNNTDGVIYRNSAANCDHLIERDDNFRDYLVVNYEFDRTEPVSAETAVIVTRYTSSQKEFRKNFVSEERSFNISVFLPDAAVECAFIWALINCEKIELSLMSSFQTVNFVIQNFQPQQVQKADLFLYVKKLILENVSFAICQPWEEILLVKKPENSFIWDSEYCRTQKAQVEIFIKSSNVNGSSQNQPVKNIVMGSDCLSHSFAYFDVVGKDDTISLTSQANSILLVKGNINISEKAKSEQNEEMVRYKDEQEESQISILPQKITNEKQEVDILIRNDDNKFKYELSRQKFEDPKININILSTIRQYVDELFDFDPVTAIICEQKDVDKLNTIGNQIESGLDFIDKVYLDCSFCRRSEHAEASENRNLSVSEMETLASSSSHLTGNFSPSRIASLNLNPISKNMVSNKKSIESTAEVRSLACEAICDSNEDSKQNLDNLGNKKLHSKLDTCNSFTTPDMQPYPDLSARTYPLHLTKSIESTNAGPTFDANEEFEVFGASANPRLQHDESFSTPSHPSANKFDILGAEHSKSSHIGSETVNVSTSNTKISIKESLSTHGSTTDDLSRTGVADKIRKDIEDEIKMKSKDNEKVFQIERAIYEISEQIEKIERQQSLTEAEAEAGEELLKTVLENIIKNVGQDSVVETMVAYKKPVVLLREKLTDLEETLMRGDSESRKLSKSIPEAEPIFSKSLNEEDLYAVRQSSIEREIRGTSLCALRQVGIIDKEEIRRMTPLTSNIKEQLQSLECMLEEVEKEEENDMKELTEEIKVTIPVYCDDKRHEVHSILMQINNEISFIKRCCQRNISKTSVDAAIRLLHKVRNNVSSMIDLISMYRKRFKRKSPATNRERMKLSKRTSHHLFPTSKTGFFFKADASVNFYLMKHEESEIINAIVKLCSSSNKSGNQMSKSQNSEISTYEDELFNDKSMTLQETGINNAPWTAVLEPGTEKNDKVTLSNFGEPQSNSFSLHSLQDSQEAVPIPPPRRLRGISQQCFPPPIPPPRLRRRSKSYDNYKNLLVLSCASDTQNRLKPMQQNMTMNEKEVSIYASDYSDPVNIKDLEDAEESNLSTSQQKSKKLNEINSDRIIRKEENFYSCSYTWPSKVKYRISFEIFDESSPMQLLCEDSDYLPESLMHSFLFFEPTKRVQEENEEELLQTLELLSDLNKSKVETVIENATKRRQNFAKLKDEREAKNFHPIQESPTPELDESYNQHISECLTDVGQKINENSKLIENPRNSSSEDENFEDIQKSAQHLHASSNTKARESTITNPLEDEANSLHEIESIDDGDEILDELDDLMVICNPHTDVIDSIDLLPTIMENSESSKIANPFMSMSTNTVISVSMPDINIPATSQDVQQTVVEDKKQSDIKTPTLESSLERKNLIAKTVNVPFSRSNKDGVNFVDSYKKKIILICEDDTKQVSEETTINVTYKSCSSKLKVIATLSPEVRAQVEACAVNGEDFDVLVEQPDEAQDFTVKLLDHISDSISLDLRLSNTVEVNLSLIRSEQYEGILSYQVGYLIGGETNEERISTTSDYEQHHHSSKTAEDRVRHTGISVNIVARSMHDVARASLEEIPWGKVSMYIVMQPIMTRSISDSGTRNSLIQNVTVSESNETEKRSLHSHESFRSSSRQSFDWTEFSDRSASWQNLNVPSYVVREGSTATITCEFNNFLAPGSLIDWFKGKTMMQILPGKTDRISHDLLEVLVISHVSLMDGDVYSIRVNDIIYPVACLIVENVDTSSEKINSDIHFISPPQTLFVMEGQPSIISCQVNSANQKVEWCKDNKKWVTENERIQLEADQFGFHRIIIDKSELEDQGTYYAFLGDHFTTVTLVVEERIDEREVTISALGTETGEDDYREYLVPLGSTATIACELENSDEVQELMWRKNGIQIEFSDDAKLEHVVNGLKHYLVIHDTQADDSASYSICINDNEFKIAHLIVSNCTTSIGSKHTKRISRNSLN